MAVIQVILIECKSGSKADFEATMKRIVATIQVTRSIANNKVEKHVSFFKNINSLFIFPRKPMAA